MLGGSTRGLEEGRCELRGEGQSKVCQAAKDVKDTPGVGRQERVSVKPLPSGTLQLEGAVPRWDGLRLGAAFLLACLWGPGSRDPEQQGVGGPL